jgi:DNA-binding CsgD family transcriptional regulator
VLVIRGDAGIGKTALLEHLIDAASGCRVVRAIGIESEMEIPFAALHQLCASMLDRLDALPEPQRDAARTAFGLTVGAAPDRLLIGLALLNLLSAVSDDGPLLCVVDGAHWLDRASTQALTFVARRFQADPVCVVFATCWLVPDLAEFPELVVDGLHDRDALTLLSRVLQVPVDVRVRERIVAETRGNPLALVEWPRDMTPAELAGGFGMPALLPMPGQIQESFRRRIAELPPATHRFLTVAASEPTGDPVIVWRAASALDVGPDDPSPAIDAGLIELGVRVSFRHPLVRSAAYASATLADRQAAHRALAQATDAESDPDRQAWHRALGSPGPDEEIATALEQSADRARARGGLAASAALIERSVALTLDPARRAQRLLAAAAAHLEAGSLETAAGLMASADASPLDDMSRAQLDVLRARHAMFGADTRDGPGLWLRAAKRLEPLDLDLARVAHIQAMAAAGTVDGGVSLRETSEAALACPRPPLCTTKEWILIGHAQFTVEGPAIAAPTLRRALQAPVDDTALAQVTHWLGQQLVAASLLWDFDALRELAVRYVETARELGALTVLPFGLNSLAHSLLFEGDLDAAASSLAEATQILDANGSNRLYATSVAIHSGLQGAEGASRVIEDQIARARASHGFRLASVLWAAAILYNGLGQYEAAFGFATEASECVWARSAPAYMHELIEAAARCGQTAAGAAALERLKENTMPSGTDWAIGIQRRSEALLAEGTAAEDCYRDAIDHLSRTAIRPELARAHLLYGEWLRRQNRRVDARAQLRTAHQMLTDMGIEAFAERARNELLATGETVRKRTVDLYAELTSQEDHIARLAADELTNAEIGSQLFISPRTVEWHLRKVFTKLDVSSRRQLRAALVRSTND